MVALSDHAVNVSIPVPAAAAEALEVSSAEVGPVMMRMTSPAAQACRPAHDGLTGAVRLMPLAPAPADADSCTQSSV